MITNLWSQLHRADWQASPPQNLPATQATWLYAAGSLTQHLQQALQSIIQVQVLTEQWQVPDQQEAKRLALPQTKQLVYLREVNLCAHDQVLITARSLFPRPSYQALESALTRLGNRPLADILFNEPTIERSPFEIAFIKQNSVTYWARRSVFYYTQQPLLITECFLPIFWQCLSR